MGSRWTAGGLVAYLRAIAPGVRPVGEEEAERAWAEVRSRHPERRIFLYYGTRAGLPLMLLACRAEATLGRDLAFVHDATFGGRVTAEALRLLGRPSWPLRHRRDADRAQDVARLIRSATSVGIAVDGRGPYGRVGPAFPRLAARCRAVAVPLAVSAGRSFRLRLAGPIEIPRPGTDLAIALGAPIDCASGGADLGKRMQEELEATLSAAQDALGPSTGTARSG